MTYYSWPPGVRIPDMPDIGAVTDDSSVVGEHAGSGRFRATALRDYVYAYTRDTPGLVTTNNTGRNLLNNGSFLILQRGAGPFASVPNTITADRWNTAVTLDDASFAFADVTDADRAAIGYGAARTKAQIFVDGDASSPSSYTVFGQAVEDVRRLAGRTLVLSFYGRVTAGTARIGASVDQVFGTGGSPSASVESTGTSVLLTTTWARYSIPIVVPAVTGKVLGTNGNDHTKIAFWLSSGSTFSARAGGVPVQSATFELWGVQLEAGTVASPVEMVDYGDEMRRCQRFYQVGQLLWAGAMTAGATYAVASQYPVMRGLPLIGLYQNNCVNTGAPSLAINGFNASVSAVASSTASGVLNVVYTLYAEPV